MNHETLVIRVDPATLVVEQRGNLWSVSDPRMAFTMLLDFERRRRNGERVPPLRIELPAGADAALRTAIERHLPQVEIATISIVRVPPTSPRTGEQRETRPLISAEELAMLFEVAQRDAADDNDGARS